jgi:hypothetical protein
MYTLHDIVTLYLAPYPDKGSLNVARLGSELPWLARSSPGRAWSCIALTHAVCMSTVAPTPHLLQSRYHYLWG